jgi:glycosyltransferase involved in cell wall biosynthesis
MGEALGIYFLSVVIPVYHDWPRLQLCLNALELQSFPKKSFEVIVVNNNPSDRPPEGFWVPDNCIIVEEAKPGSYAARNKGAAQAIGEVLVFTDADCIPSVDWLKLVSQYYERGSGILSGRVEMFSVLNKKKLSFPESYDYIYGINQDIYAENDVGATANLAVDKCSFKKLNGFDAKVYSGGDVDFCNRASECKINFFYSDKVYVSHPLRCSSHDLLSKARRLLAGKLKRNFWGGLVVALSPPLVRLHILFFKKKAPLDVKFKAIFFLFFVKIVQVSEMVLLLAGKADERQ